MHSQSPHFNPAVIASTYPRVAVSVACPSTSGDTLPPAAIQTRSILVADADDKRRGAVASLLRSDGYMVIERDNVYTLLGDLLTVAPDLVLLGVRAGDASHIDVCRELRIIDPSRMTPILLLGRSGDDDEDTILRGLDAGADDYITDAGRSGELRARVRAQLRNRRDREVLQWAQEQRSSFRQLALTDPLTGIGNRRHGVRAIDDLLARKQPLTVLIIDLDHFKSVNDTWGHEAGDMVLQRVARAIQRVSLPGTTVSRWGGEEFAVIFPGECGEGAASLGETYRQAILDVVFFGMKGPSRVTASVGVAEWDGRYAAPTRDELVRAADGALYASKNAGRNRVSVATTLESKTWTVFGAEVSA